MCCVRFIKIKNLSLRLSDVTHIHIYCIHAHIHTLDSKQHTHRVELYHPAEEQGITRSELRIYHDVAPLS